MLSFATRSRAVLGVPAAARGMATRAGEPVYVIGVGMTKLDFLASLVSSSRLSQSPLFFLFPQQVREARKEGKKERKNVEGNGFLLIVRRPRSSQLVFVSLFCFRFSTLHHPSFFFFLFLCVCVMVFQ